MIDNTAKHDGRGGLGLPLLASINASYATA